MVENRENATTNAPTEESPKANSEYLAGTVDALKDRLTALDDREARLISSASTATNWLRYALSFWTVILFGILGITTYSSFQLDEVIQEAKREVREIAGSIRPDGVQWGRIEPGDSSHLVFELFLSRGDDDRAILTGVSYPKLDVIGASATLRGWRYTLHDEMLDWRTSSNDFQLENTSAQFSESERYRRSRFEHGEILWIKDNDRQTIALSLLPGASWAGRFSIGMNYSSCEDAVRAATQLKMLSEEDALGQLGLAPVISNYPVSEEYFDIEIVFSLDNDFACWSTDKVGPSDPMPEFKDL